MPVPKPLAATVIYMTGITNTKVKQLCGNRQLPGVSYSEAESAKLTVILKKKVHILSALRFYISGHNKLSSSRF